MNKQKNKLLVEITGWSFAKLLILILGLVFLYYIRNVVALIFVVIILVAGFTPFIKNLEKYKIPRGLAIIILYLIIFAFIGFLVYLVIPPVIDQVSNFALNLTFYKNKLNSVNLGSLSVFFRAENNLQIITNVLSKLTGGVFNSIVNIFGGAAAAITVFVLTFYILLERDSIEKFIFTFVPEDTKKHALRVYEKISSKLGNWLRGQIILAIIIGVACYIVLSILGVPYALALAVLAGVLEIVPIIGPIVAGVTAGLVALIVGETWQVFAVIIIYIAIQQVEAHFLVPRLMGKAVGLSPVIIIIALMIGGVLGGIVGALLAIPVAAGVSVVIREWPNLTGKKQENPTETAVEK